MIFLFANEGYGALFVTAVRQYARENDAAVTVVISSRKVGNRRGRLRQVAVAWWLMRHVRFVLPMLADPRCQIRIVKDVNSEAFGRRITPSDVGVIAGFNQIFHARLRTRFARLVNIHPSLLPFYRGPVPSEWCLRNGELRTGYTVHDVVEAIDAGQILLQAAIDIEPTDTPASLDERIAKAATRGMPTLLDALTRGSSLTPLTIDARSEYRVLVDYASWPTASVRPLLKGDRHPGKD